MAGLNNKWDYAIHYQQDQCIEFWTDRLKDSDKNILMVLGLGWDPRNSVFLDFIRSIGGQGKRVLNLISYKPFDTFISPHQNYIDKNFEIINQVVEKFDNFLPIQIDTRNGENYYIGDKEIAKFYKNFDIADYDDIIVDISALPKSIYFTLLYILVHKVSKFHNDLNIHVVVCQHSDLDSRIIESIDDTRFLSGFKGNYGRIGKENIPKIWVPLLAKNHTESLISLRELTAPRDIYPIMPFPSKNPREDDEILMEYSSIFADEWSFNLMNFIYATEDSPIDVYQRLIKLYHQQKEAFDPLGGVSMVISPLSSKLSSLGAFMAAYEKKFAVAHTIGRHRPPSDMSDGYWDKTSFDSYKQNLHSIWLTGEPYEL